MTIVSAPCTTSRHFDLPTAARRHGRRAGRGETSSAVFSSTTTGEGQNPGRSHHVPTWSPISLNVKDSHMRQRGRKSVSATTTPLTVISERRLPPPADLTDAERSAWLAITSCRPGSWFDAASVPLLTALIRHQQSANVLAGEIAQFDSTWLRDDDGLERYRSLLAPPRQDSCRVSVANLPKVYAHPPSVRWSDRLTRLGQGAVAGLQRAHRAVSRKDPISNPTA